jgi:glycosyltransferase involved in cell wall biosynthesis
LTSTNKNYKDIGSIAVIGNYLPRLCGIATFTTDLVEAISKEAPNVNLGAVVMNDIPEGYKYPEKVQFEIQQNKLSDYSIASEYININQMDIVCVQHEYGIFGGPAGSHVLKLLGELRMPVVTTLHTVLKDPKPEYREVMLKLADLSERLIVMSRKAIDFLTDNYNIPEEKITFIHHGIPDVPFVDSNFYKEQFRVEGKKVLLTFGLLSPNKGIEHVLQALPMIIKKHPDIAYIILGATHPNILKAYGDEYRIRLQQLVQKLNLSGHVHFQNRFVELNELCEFLGAADVYITPYLEEAQITSGTLIYAMGSGKPVVSTPYWYATEMLADGRGVIVPFQNSNAIAEQITTLFDQDIDRHQIRKRAYNFTREAVWSEVSKRYLDIFLEVKLKRSQHPRPRHLYSDNIKSITNFELPEIKFDHLKIMTDDTGILQHATYTIPNRNHGYCTDDNARALVVTGMAYKYSSSNSVWLDSLSSLYLSFLLDAYNEDNGRFRNFLTYSRQWMEEIGSEDSHGRALWGLGKIIVFSNNIGQMEVASLLFKRALKAVEEFTSPRAMAFALVGIHAYLEKFSGDSEVRRIREVLAENLFKLFKNNATQDWPWPEKKICYTNGKFVHALLLSGQWMQRNDMIEMGLNSLKWLLDIQTENGHFVPIGNNGWYEQDHYKARFDQQPIEANAMIEACVEAFNFTRNRVWLDSAVMCFNWFLGHNDLNLSLYDPKTGGCRDGLMADGINQNEGAESSLAWLLSLMTLQNLYSYEILKQPTSKSIV